jgi:hypothetical protein
MKKRGRPPVWPTEDGKRFVQAVLKVQYERCPIKLAAAIQALTKPKSEFAHLGKQYSQRYLQKKVQENSDHHAVLSPIPTNPKKSQCSANKRNKF